MSESVSQTASSAVLDAGELPGAVAPACAAGPDAGMDDIENVTEPTSPDDVEMSSRCAEFSDKGDPESPCASLAGVSSKMQAQLPPSTLADFGIEDPSPSAGIDCVSSQVQMQLPPARPVLGFAGCIGPDSVERASGLCESSPAEFMPCEFPPVPLFLKVLR